MQEKPQKFWKSCRSGKVLAGSCPCLDRMVLTDNRGSVLLLALVMLVIMSALGMLAMSTSSTEQSITGNFRAKREAFYAADRAVNYAGANPDFFLGTSVNDLGTDATHRSKIASGLSGLDPDPAATNEVRSTGGGPMPEKAKSDAMMFEALYSTISVTGAYPIDPLDASKFPNRARVSVETQVVRIVNSTK